MGANPRPDERIVHCGKIVTAAGVSAGIDLALWLAGKIVGRERAEAIQLTIEYDPHPPFDAGHISKASKATQKLAKEIMDNRVLVQREMERGRSLLASIWLFPRPSLGDTPNVLGWGKTRC